MTLLSDSHSPVFKAIIFDMDGVITDTMPYHCRAWRQIFADNGFCVPEFEVYRREGQKGIESVRELCAREGRAFSMVQAQKMLADKEVLFKKIVRRKFIRGARTFIRKARRSGCRLAVVTGTARHEMERILPPALLALFEVTVTGSDVHRGKPHPEPYRKALEALGVKSSETLVIENAPLGIRSAKAAGCTCFALATSLPPRYLQEADHVFRGFSPLTAYLKGL